jgi:hypothetical protein
MNRFNLIHKGSALAGMILLIYPFSTLIGEEDAMAIEEPSYSVVESYDDFEIRSYEANLVAQIKTQGEFDSAGNQGFRALADYIFGNNDKKSKIAMTAPVKMSGTGTADEYNIQFVMPRELKKEDLPQPKNQDLKILSIPKKLMAVHRYSGTWSRERFLEHQQILLTQIKSHGYQPVSEAIFARYNPPFIPWFLRRNEVWIEVQK